MCGYCTAKGRIPGVLWERLRRVFHGISKPERSRAVPELINTEPLNSKRLLNGHSGDKGRLNRRA